MVSEVEPELLRAELLSIEQLKRYAITLAESHQIDPKFGPDFLLIRLSDNADVILEAYQAILNADSSTKINGKLLSPAEKWLLDNYYLIQQQITLAQRHLPRGYSKQLPRLIGGVSNGFPRIYDLALNLISHMDGRIDRENTTQLISAYQSVEPLMLGELWAFPIMLQLALIENLRRVSVRISNKREEQESAIIWADRMLAAAENEPKKLIHLLALFADADIQLTAPFVEEFYARLQVQGPAMAFVQTWVEQQLLSQHVTATQLLESASRTAAANQISLANSIGSLRFIASIDWRNFVESLSFVEQILNEDPNQQYALQDFATRDRYRHAVEDVARLSAKNKIAEPSHYCAQYEISTARAAIDLASAAQNLTSRRSWHVGYYLIDEGLSLLKAKLNGRNPLASFFKTAFLSHRLMLYVGSILVLTSLFTAGIILFVQANAMANSLVWLIAGISFISSSALAVSLINLLVTKTIHPHGLPRLDFSKGIPEQHRTIVVIPTLISNLAEIDSLLEALEIRYLGNRDANLLFGLLTDFKDATTHTTPEDADLIAYAGEGVKALNTKYASYQPSTFYLFHRQREWNAVDRIWMGYERKRGKLEQFNALLRDGFQTTNQLAFAEIIGDTSVLSSIQYVITLDTDTQLPRDSAYKLIGNMAHALNRPVFDEGIGRVVKGYAILQPRASIGLMSANQTWFSKIFAGESGMDPYTREVSDVYQDIFAEGSFIGKGIYDVDAFRLAVDGRFPNNLILSHDLLESGYARSALVTDVDLIEEHPASYAADISRRHRWIRGDWQLAGWLLPRVPAADGLSANRQPNPLSALSIWKIIDNLRRSLIPFALLSMLLSAWLLEAAFLTMLSIQMVVLAVLFLPAVISSLIELLNKPKERAWLAHLNLTSQTAQQSLSLVMLSLTFLPYEAVMHLDAIANSAGRMLFTKRGLLLWHLPIYAKRNACKSWWDFYKEMWIAPAISALLVAFLIGVQIAQTKPFMVWPFCLPILLLWFISPLVAWRISKPIHATVENLTLDQTVFLQSSARRTWRYFDQFVNAEDNWLPPDNVQQYPTNAIATRTSPTNIGMGLLANLAAYDFGYITVSELLRLTHNTLTTMEKLPRYHGHFYNWYDTRTLQVLNPQYISSVDSGNLAGSLLTLLAGLLELKHQPLDVYRMLQGLNTTLSVLAEHVPSLPAKVVESKIKSLQEILQQNLVKSQQSLQSAIPLFLQIQQIANALVAALPVDVNKQDELTYWVHAFNVQANAFSEALHHSLPINVAVDMKQAQVIDDLVERTAQLSKMDFSFLYDNATDLLSIGFDASERRRDPSCYDLLASEARLASFLLIAQGQLPQKHWFSLGRLLTSVGGDISLLSWSGSMFEYLMPQLMMPSFENTLLNQTCKAVVKRQIKYGQLKNIPWGISESCYNATDIAQVYQYRAFGVPGLGLKRGLADDLVVAPYASALALMVLPNEACKNLQKLSDSGFVGQYGFYEAIDYTPNRLPRGKNHAAVLTFMAHHQGMSLLAFAYVLLNKPMQRRFMSDPAIKATELLLQERIPKQGATLQPHALEEKASVQSNIEAAGETMRVFNEPNTAIPEVHLLSNGRYHVMATNAGGGYSRWHDLAVTRWREDTTQDNWGTFIYVRDIERQRYWSAAHQPTLTKADFYEAVFSQARAEYRRRDQSIETHTEISVSPEDDVEIRRVTLTNLSTRPRQMEITSYAEVILAPQNADLAHRSFSNLFVQTEILHDRQAIICTRRPRTQDERVPWMFHLIAVPTDDEGENYAENSLAPSYETDRAKFIGRGRTAKNPVVFNSQDNSSKMTGNLLGQVSSQITDQLFGRVNNRLDQALSQPLSNTDGSVLDPIVAIRRSIRLAADQSLTVQIISGVASSREAAMAMIDKYGDRHFVERAFEMAWFQSQEVLRMLNASEADAQTYGRLASSVIYCNPMRRAAPSVISRNQLGQSGLWRFGVSGDLPVVLIRIGDINRLNLVKQLLQAHTYWRMNGLIADLVIINEDFSGYRADLQDQIIGLINAGPEAQTLDKPGGVFIKRVEELSEEARVLFQTVARLVFTDSSDSLIEQVERRIATHRLSDRAYERLEPLLPAYTQTDNDQPTRTLIFNNGIGGFTPDGREYVIRLNHGQTTPAPWVNVIASPYIGTVVSESGSAYTWVENAHEFRLTSWHNDPISDNSGETHYIRDEETGIFWSPTPLPACTAAQGKSDYVCRHGFGYTIFEHTESGIHSEMTTYVAIDAPVKFVVIKLRNQSDRTRKLSLTAYWELVMGEWRHYNLMHIVTETDTQTGAILAHNAYGRECANRVVFAHLSEKEVSLSGSRAEFIGRNGSLASPAAMRRKRLSNRTGAGLDPCAALQSKITLHENEERVFVFVFGAASNNDEAQHYIQRFGGVAGARQALDTVHEYWNHTLGAVQVETPDNALNMLANGWLIYQTISCRLWGRSGYYQSGGAYGFRDQLQDTMALIHATPWLAREQILRCAERQFPQGDVQHWWHPPNGQGVRTHFSDDYLWLAYATCRYVATTGDMAILDEQVHFLEGRALNQHEEAYYDLPQRSNESASLYEHCVRAIKHGLRFGTHQLPLIGCGDWNDGMNLIGRDGKGESVWLAWFLVENLSCFSVLANRKGDIAFAQICTTQAALLKGNIETNAWDGEWYRRAYFDDGTPLGSKDNDECQIDSISQSWAVISKSGDSARTKQAMAAVNQRLVNRDAQLIKLLDPPFNHSQLEPGYIKGYVPGVRENGGQYTHAAIWATMAFAMQGEIALAWELYGMLNPVNHGSSAEQIQTYKVEPYVMSADIYATAPHTGRGGWTWYTGAAGWMYRLTLETLLGITLENDLLMVKPAVPQDWLSYKIHYRYRDTLYHITINLIKSSSESVARVMLDNVMVDQSVFAVQSTANIGSNQCYIPLANDHQEHYVQVEIAI